MNSQGQAALQLVQSFISRSRQKIKPLSQSGVSWKMLLLILSVLLASFPQNAAPETQVVDSIGAPFEVMVDSIFGI